MTSPHTSGAIERKLRERLAPIHLDVIDDSHLHAGHAGARAGGGHYRVTVVSEAFAPLGRVERHRLVYDILNEEMSGAIHALALRTLAPAEWRAERTGKKG